MTVNILLLLHEYFITALIYFIYFWTQDVVRCACDDMSNIYQINVHEAVQDMRNLHDDTHHVQTPKWLLSEIKINIGIVFHLVDPVLNVPDAITFWQNHITQKILPRINADFNVNTKQQSNVFAEEIKKLFLEADVEKRNYYLEQAATFPDMDEPIWNFWLDTVVLKPNKTNIQFNGKNNEALFRRLRLADPHQRLNIVVAPGGHILGKSVFPFDMRLLSQHAILIDTRVFTGTFPPFHLYRTFTHEIGHWCGLIHIFDDGVRQKVTRGTVYDKVIHQTDCINGKVKISRKRDTPYAYIFEKGSEYPAFYNFMDYTDDHQMCMFNQRQMEYMVYVLLKYRPAFVTKSRNTD